MADRLDDATGRMREGALPSRTNQARVVSEIWHCRNRATFAFNLIEAYTTSPGNARVKGTVGGYWGADQYAQRREV